MILAKQYLVSLYDIPSEPVSVQRSAETTSEDEDDIRIGISPEKVAPAARPKRYDYNIFHRRVTPAQIDDQAPLEGLKTPRQSDNINAAKPSSGKKWPKVAVCMVGGLRTFFLKRVHQPFQRHFIDQLGPVERRDIYFDSSLSFHCASNAMASEEENESCRQFEKIADKKAFAELVEHMQAKSIQYVEDFDCKHPFLSKHMCCRKEVQAKKFSGAQWNGFFSYQRKVHCYENALKNEDPDDPYQYFIIARPDLAYFDSIPNMMEIASRPDRIYAASKEGHEAMGDYFYIVPRTLAKEFFYRLKHLYDAKCREDFVPWPPEYSLHPVLQQFPLQVLPLPFTIVRPNGHADCFRMRNEVFHRNKGFVYKGEAMHIADVCEKLVFEGYFKVENAASEPYDFNSFVQEWAYREPPEEAKLKVKE